MIEPFFDRPTVDFDAPLGGPLSVQVVGGQLEFFIGDALVAVGSRLQVLRDGAWHNAKVELDHRFDPVVSIESEGWSGPSRRLDRHTAPGLLARLLTPTAP